MVLFLFSSVKYNRIIYTLQSYMWIKNVPDWHRTTSQLLAEQTAFVQATPLATNITRQTQASIRCGLVLDSDLMILPAAHKTDLYNISKLRSFVYTSLQRLAVYNVDIITRPLQFTFHIYNSPLNETEMKSKVTSSLQFCFSALAAPPTGFTVKEFIQHQRNDMPTAMVTEIAVQNAFCPTSAELNCMQDFVGIFTATPSSRCIAGIDILFTSSNPENLLSTFESYMAQIQNFDVDMRLSRPSLCTKVLYIRHKAYATSYADAIYKQQNLSQAHLAYRQFFSGAVIFDSGVHSLTTYNVTMQIASNRQPISMSTAIDLKFASQRLSENKARIARVLSILGVDISVADIGFPATMNLREDGQRMDSVIFSLTGGILTDINTRKLLNTTVWISTSRFANATSIGISQFSASISGEFSCDLFSAAKAQQLRAHLETHQQYYLPLEGPTMYATITQSFLIPSNLRSAGILAQQGIMQEWIAASNYVFRVSVRIPVEVNRLNALLMQVLKTVIFTKDIVDSVQLVSLSSQNMVQIGGGNLTTMIEYSFVVYELPVHSVGQCDMDSNANTEDYFFEIANVVSGLFGVSIGFELHSACLVTNTLHRTIRVAPSLPSAGAIECNDGTVARHAAMHPFFNDSTVAYYESCVLQTNLAVNARFDLMANTTWTPQHITSLRTVLSAGTFCATSGALIIAMQATLQMLDSTVYTSQLVHTFASVYSHGENITHGSTVNNSSDSAGFFALYNNGMSAREKATCIATRQEVAMVPIGCVQNLSISQSHTIVGSSCVHFTTVNSRIDLNMLRRFVFAKTTTNMLRPRAISIDNAMTGYIQRMPCEGGVHNLVNALLRSDTFQNTTLVIEPRKITYATMLVRHLSPFIHVPDYQQNVLRLFKEDEIQPIAWSVGVSATLHLYTKGLSFDIASVFFGPLLVEFIRSQMQNPAGIRVKVVSIQPLQKYGPVFPDILYEKEEARVQLYIQVLVMDMVECADIQDLINRKTVQQILMGTSMEVSIIDNVDSAVLCDTLVSLQYSSSRRCAITRASILQGATVSGGTIVSSNSTCVVSTGGDCSAQFSSSDVGVFYDIFGILTGQVVPLGYYFQHTVNFCGLEADQLANLISMESLEFFGMYVLKSVLPSISIDVLFIA